MTDAEKKQLEAELWEKVRSGELTADEAENEWRDYFDPDPRYCGSEW